MKALKRYITNVFKRTKITTKVLMGYIFLVFIPVLLFGVFFYNQISEDLIENYSSDKQNLINQASSNMELSLTQVNSIYTLFQSNQTVINYLSGRYKTEGDQVYAYLKDIRPLFSFADLTNTSIESIKIFKKNENILPVIGEIEDMNSLNDSIELDKINNLQVNQDLWSINYTNEEKIVPFINYYRKIYNNKYTRELGVLEVSFNNDHLNRFLETVKASNGMNVIIARKNEVVYQDNTLQLDNLHLNNIISQYDKNISSSYWIIEEEELLVNHLYLEGLNLNFYFLSSTSQIFKGFHQKIAIFGIYLLLLLIALTAIYYLIASVLTKRVLNLANHMRKVDENKLSIYKGKTSNDEIGFLIDSYNSLINRIDELMTKVHRAEIRQKETNYQILQAQINPHFLYNTLESIRMLAEVGDNPEIVESTYRLGKLLRYSISPGENVATIEEELENIKDYLSIHKVRMGDRLSYSIQVQSQIQNITCPRFILQPLVENCIKHGISNMRKPGKVSIVITEWNAYLKIIITDNGQGICESKLKIIKDILDHKRDKSDLETKSSGIGLYNVSERIRNYFGGKSNLQVESELGHGTSFILYIKKI